MAEAPKTGSDQSHWLLLAGLGYAVVTLGIILASTATWTDTYTDLLLFVVMFVFALPLAAIGTVVIVRVQGVRFHWAAMLAFAIWIVLVACLQYRIFEQAA